MKYVIGNWKMNPETEAQAAALAAAVVQHVKHSVFNMGAEVVIAPPFPFLSRVAEAVRGTKVKLGAQDVYEGSGSVGPRTGEVSAAQLKDRGVMYVIVGHSERRALGETDEAIAGKLGAARAAGLVPILCVGEPADIRERGIASAREFVGNQLSQALIGFGNLTELLDSRNQSILIAYEPVWAISTTAGAREATPDDAAAMMEYIRENNVKHSVFNIPVLYGGSVDAENAAGFLSREEIDGVLVGGASLNAEEFVKICSM